MKNTNYMYKLDTGRRIEKLRVVPGKTKELAKRS